MPEVPPPPHAGPPPQMPADGVKPHRGPAVLVLGILGFVCCGAFGLVAWIMGDNDLKEMAAGTMDRSGESITRAGKILGAISVILWIIWVIGYIVVFLIIGAHHAARTT